MKTVGEMFIPHIKIKVDIIQNCIHVCNYDVSVPVDETTHEVFSKNILENYLFFHCSSSSFNTRHLFFFHKDHDNKPPDNKAGKSPGPVTNQEPARFHGLLNNLTLGNLLPF